MRRSPSDFFIHPGAPDLLASDTVFETPATADALGPEDTLERLPNIHPGDVLREDFLEPLGITAYQLAKATGLSQTHIGDILRGERSVTAATALRLEAYFGVEARFWVNLQAAFDLEEAREKLAPELKRIPRHPRAIELAELPEWEDAEGRAEELVSV